MGMIGAHSGIMVDYNRLNRTMGWCLVCGQYSECEILKYEKYVHFLFIRLKVLEEGYIFDWDRCQHRAQLSEKEDVLRYQREYEETGSLSVPYVKDMHPKQGFRPRKPSNLKIALVLIVVFILAGIVVWALDALRLDHYFLF